MRSEGGEGARLDEEVRDGMVSGLQVRPGGLGTRTKTGGWAWCSG